MIPLSIPGIGAAVHLKQAKMTYTELTDAGFSADTDSDSTHFGPAEAEYISVEELTDLAVQGRPDAAYEIGLFHAFAADGNGKIAAERWLRRAAEQGHPAAMLQLAGLLFEFAARDGGDMVEAATWFLKACLRGDPDAVNFYDWAHDLTPRDEWLEATILAAVPDTAH